MLIEKVLGNIKDLKLEHLECDRVIINWYEARKRIARLQSSKQKDIAIRLKEIPKEGFNQGDVLFFDEKEVITIEILPTQVLYFYTKDSLEMAKIVYEIGNLHIPLFFGKNPMEFQAPFEPPLQRLLEKFGIAYQKKEGILDSKNQLSVSKPHFEPKIHFNNDFEIKIKRE